MRTPSPALLLVALLLGPLDLAAQSIETPTAHVAYVEGAATLEREGFAEPLDSGTPLADGDRLRTAAARLEIFFTDGSTLYVDESSTLDLLAPGSLRLTTGILAFEVSTGAPYQVDTPAGSVQLAAPGEYRIEVRTSRENPVPLMMVAVAHGAAELASDIGRVALAAGEGSAVRAGELPDFPMRINTASADAFGWWIERQRTERHADSVSRPYLPEDVQAYASVFDRGGQWGAEPDYGAVWYPAVASDWRPYYNGRWTWRAHFGWTWVSHDDWGWATHHYGRWGITTAGRWYWIPGRQWGAAWVSWAIAPSYVSWCPLGFDGRPVVTFHGHRRFVNERVFDRRFGVNDRIFDPDFAWTTIHRREMGGRRSSTRGGLRARNLVERDGVPFIQQSAPPRAPERRAIRTASPQPREGRRAVGRTPAPPTTLGEAAAARRATPRRAPGAAATTTPAPGAGRRVVQPRFGQPPTAPLAPRRADRSEVRPGRPASPEASRPVQTPRGATATPRANGTVPLRPSVTPPPRPAGRLAAPAATQPRASTPQPRATRPAPVEGRSPARPAVTPRGYQGPGRTGGATTPRAGGAVPAPRQAAPRRAAPRD